MYETYRDHPDMMLQQWEDSLNQVRRAKWRKKHYQERFEQRADRAMIVDIFYNMPD